jgi:hypothetical protein
MIKAGSSSKPPHGSGGFVSPKYAAIKMTILACVTFGILRASVPGSVTPDCIKSFVNAIYDERE